MKSIWEKILLEKLEAAHYQRREIYNFFLCFSKHGLLHLAKNDNDCATMMGEKGEIFIQV